MIDPRYPIIEISHETSGGRNSSREGGCDDLPVRAD